MLGGAGLFWWSAMWIGRLVPAPDARLLAPVALLIVLAVAGPLTHGSAFFNVKAALTPDGDPGELQLALDREAGLIAVQKLLVVMLLAVPLYHAMAARGWSRRWFDLCLLAGVGLGQLLCLLQQVHGAGLPSPGDPTPALAVLAATTCWLIGLFRGYSARWARARRDLLEGEWGETLGHPDALLAGLAGLMLLGSLAVLGALLAGPVPWRSAVPWLALGAGLMIAIDSRKRAIRWLGIALAGEGAAAACLNWGQNALARSLARGGVAGWGQWDPTAADRAGLLWIAQWRGWVGLGVLACALALAGVVQWRSFARGRAQHTSMGSGGGALAGAWLLAVGWLVGPARIGGGAALLALAMWASSLTPASRPAARRERGASGSPAYLLSLTVMVIFCYGLLGFAQMAHSRLWIAAPQDEGDKFLHAVWGLYVTLICVLALSRWGRWPAVTLGLAVSLALAVAAEYAQLHLLADRTFEWADVGAYGLAGTAVALALTVLPFRWTAGATAAPAP